MFVNLTPHHLRVDGEIVPPTGEVARVAASGKVVDLPAPQEGTEYIVALGVARYVAGRPDVLSLATSRAEVVVPNPVTIESWFARLKLVGIRTGMVSGIGERWGYGLILPDGGEYWLDDGVPDGDIFIDREEVSPAMWLRILDASRGFEGAWLDEDGNLFVLPEPCSWDDSFVPVEAP